MAGLFVIVMVFLRRKILVLALAVEGAAALLALALSALLNIQMIPFSGNIVKDIVTGTAAAVPPFVFFIFASSEKAVRIPGLGTLRQKIVTEIKGIFDIMSFPDLVLISLMAGIGEELLFRGVIQTRFGIAAASVLFGLMHPVSRAYVLVTAAMGVYIGMVFHYSGSLLAAVQLHFVYDLAALVYLKHCIKVPDQGNQVSERLDHKDRKF